MHTHYWETLVDSGEEICLTCGKREPIETTDDDPQCICGVYRSEHFLCGCPDGFQTSASWDRARAAMRVYASHEYDDQND